jgi:hypothetical protein
MLEDHDSTKWNEKDIQDVFAVSQSYTSPCLHSTLSLFPAPATHTIPNSYKDLVTGVLGIQVSANIETVLWMSGQRTILPYLENGSRTCMKDILQQDRDYMADLAWALEALPSSSLIVFLYRNTEEKLFSSEKQDHYCPRYINTKGFKLTEEWLWKRYSIFVD